MKNLQKNMTRIIYIFLVFMCSGMNLYAEKVPIKEKITVSKEVQKKIPQQENDKVIYYYKTYRGPVIGIFFLILGTIVLKEWIKTVKDCDYIGNDNATIAIFNLVGAIILYILALICFY